MARFITVAALAVAGLSVGGCMYNSKSGLERFHNASVTSVNEPVVQRTDYVFDVAAGSGGIAPSELDRLNGWFDSLGLEYGDLVFVDTAGSYGGGTVRSDVARVAESYGLLLSEGAPITAGRVPPGSVRVVVSRSKASVPGCPTWDPNTIGARITTSPNYGCALNSNLAAMIANPNDLVIGQSGDTSIDAATASKAIKTYRDKALSGGGGSAVQQVSSKGGN